MILKGIASTGSKDRDNENLKPEGLDFSYFLKKGYANWNHDQLTLIGKPLKATLNKSNQWETELRLFPKSKTAQQVYELQKVLESEGLGLGLSIEGQVIKRGSEDKNDPRYNIVEKALITGCAVTPHPKNADAIVNIVKGDLFDDDFKDNFLKSMALIEKEEDKIGDDDKEDKKDEEKEEKGMDSTSAAPLIKESLEDKKCKTMITKGEAYNIIDGVIPDISKATKDEIINKIIKEQEMENATLAITEDKIKAYLGGVKKSLEIQPVQTAATDDPTNQKIADLESKLEKALSAVETLTKKLEEGQAGQAATEVAKVAKGTPSNSLFNEPTDELTKGIGEVIQKGFGDLKTSIDSKFDDQAELYKSLSDQLDELAGKVHQLETTPLPLKTVGGTGYVQKGGFQNQNNGTPTGRVVSLSNIPDKNYLCDELTKSIIDPANPDNILDKALANDIRRLATTGMPTERIVKKAQELGLQVSE